MVIAATSMTIFRLRFVSNLILGTLMIFTLFKLVTRGINATGGRTSVMSEGHLLVRQVEFL